MIANSVVPRVSNVYVLADRCPMAYSCTAKIYTVNTKRTKNRTVLWATVDPKTAERKKFNVRRHLKKLEIDIDYYEVTLEQMDEIAGAMNLPVWVTS
jgi:hypothetical protein